MLVDDRVRLAETREREINQISQSISQLADMFRELHTLVIDQGTVLDRIDYNLELTVEHTKSAVTELEQVTTLLAVFMLIGRFRRRKSRKSRPRRSCASCC